LFFKNRRGFTLIASLILIIFVSITIIGVTFFIIQRLSLNEAVKTRAQGAYLAQAGIQQAVYFYRFRDISGTGYFSLGQTNLDAYNFFVLGADDADLLMVNTSASGLGGGSKHLEDWDIQNAADTRAITIKEMTVTWNNARNLKQVRLNNSKVWDGPDTPSPAVINITDFTLTIPPTLYDKNELRFSGDMTGATVTVQFKMLDNTSKTVTLYPGSNNNNFTVKSTGKTTGSNIYRTSRAEYNALTARIVNDEEITQQITP